MNDDLPDTETEALLALARAIAAKVLAEPKDAHVMEVFARLCAETDAQAARIEVAGSHPLLH